jgi:hypothetical protein
MPGCPGRGWNETFVYPFQSAGKLSRVKTGYKRCYTNNRIGLERVKWESTVFRQVFRTQRLLRDRPRDNLSLGHERGKLAVEDHRWYNVSNSSDSGNNYEWKPVNFTRPINTPSPSPLLPIGSMHKPCGGYEVVHIPIFSYFCLLFYKEVNFLKKSFLDQ